MPYFLKQVGKKYFVVDTSGKQYSKKPLPKARAERQLKALHINTGHGLYGGKLEETWPMIKDHLDQVTTQVVNPVDPTKKGFALLSKSEQKKELEKQLTGVIQELIPLFDEENEQRTLITRGHTYIGKILSSGFSSPEMYETKEQLAEIAKKPIGHIIGNVRASSDIPVFRRTPMPEHLKGINPSDARYYYTSRSTEKPMSTEEDVQLPPTSRERMLAQLLEINRRTGQYYNDLIQAGYTAALTPAEVKARDEAQAKATSGKGRYSEPDTHILIGDYLKGSGTGKWTALINALARMYNIPKVLVDSTIALNDRKTGPQRFNAKKQNILSQFSDYLNPTVVSEIRDLDESDPNSVSDYANTIDGRIDLGLSLRSVNTVNPLQVSVATTNPLSGRGRRKIRGGLSRELLEQIVTETGNKIANDENPEKWLGYNQEMFKRIVAHLDTTQQEKRNEILGLISELMRQAEVSISKGFKEGFFKMDTWNLFVTLLGLNEASAREQSLRNKSGKLALDSSARRHAQQEVEAFVEPEEGNVQVQAQESDRTSYAPQQSRTGQGKIKFVKKYLRGQGLPATKKIYQKFVILWM